MASPGPMERTRNAIIEVEAEADFRRRLERSGGGIRLRGWQRDRLAVRTPAVPSDGASDEQDAGDGVGEDPQSGEPSG
jgi:hypothetical protein